MPDFFLPIRFLAFQFLFSIVSTNNGKNKIIVAEVEDYEIKKSMAKGGGVEGEYSTKNASRDDVNSLIDMLNDLDISYDLDGSNEWIDFDMTELDREQQEQVKQWLGIGKMAKGGYVFKGDKYEYVPTKFEYTIGGL
jgi:hypothetical protein